jgi:hypothetical protein
MLARARFRVHTLMVVKDLAERHRKVCMTEADARQYLLVRLQGGKSQTHTDRGQKVGCLPYRFQISPDAPFRASPGVGIVTAGLLIGKRRRGMPQHFREHPVEPSLRFVGTIRAG